MQECSLLDILIAEVKSEIDRNSHNQQHFVNQRKMNLNSNAITSSQTPLY